MSEVVPLRGERLPGQPDQSVVEDLEALLADAKAGTLIGFAYAGVKVSGVTCTGWSGAAGTRHPLSSAIAMLQHRYAEGLLKG